MSTSIGSVAKQKELVLKCGTHYSKVAIGDYIYYIDDGSNGPTINEYKISAIIINGDVRFKYVSAAGIQYDLYDVNRYYYDVNVIRTQYLIECTKFIDAKFTS